MDELATLLRATSSAPECFINGLPNETLAEILHYTVQMPVFFRQKPSGLALVCHKWNQVTGTFGELWSHIFLGDRTSINVLRVYLRRSMGLPLSVHFSDKFASFCSPDKLAMDLSSGRGVVIPAAAANPNHPLAALRQLDPPQNPQLDLIFQECHRWKELYMEETQVNEVMRRLRLQSSLLPLLQRIDLVVPRNFPSRLPTRAVDIQEALYNGGNHARLELPRSSNLTNESNLWSNLRELRINTQLSHIFILDRFLIRPSINSLDITITQYTTSLSFSIWHLLAQIPLLSSLKLASIDSSNNVFWIGKRTLGHHDHLSSIHLKGSFDFIWCLVPVIDCASPKLKHLEIHTNLNSNLGRGPQQQQVIPIPPLPQLESLTIETHVSDTAKFLDFADLPGLKILAVDHGAVSSVQNLRSKIVRRAEVFLQCLLEQALNTQIQSTQEEHPSKAVALRRVWLRSAHIGERETELLSQLAEKIPQKLSIILKGCEFSQDTLLERLQSSAEVLIFSK